MTVFVLPPVLSSKYKDMKTQIELKNEEVGPEAKTSAIPTALGSPRPPLLSYALAFRLSAAPRTLQDLPGLSLMQNPAPCRGTPCYLVTSLPRKKLPLPQSSRQKPLISTTPHQMRVPEMVWCGVARCILVYSGVVRCSPAAHSRFPKFPGRQPTLCLTSRSQCPTTLRAAPLSQNNQRQLTAHFLKPVGYGCIWLCLVAFGYFKLLRHRKFSPKLNQPPTSASPSRRMPHRMRTAPQPSWIGSHENRPFRKFSKTGRKQSETVGFCLTRDTRHFRVVRLFRGHCFRSSEIVIPRPTLHFSVSSPTRPITKATNSAFSKTVSQLSLLSLLSPNPPPKSAKTLMFYSPVLPAGQMSLLSLLSQMSPQQPLDCLPVCQSAKHISGAPRFSERGNMKTNLTLAEPNQELVSLPSGGLRNRKMVRFLGKTVRHSNAASSLPPGFECLKPLYAILLIRT